MVGYVIDTPCREFPGARARTGYGRIWDSDLKRVVFAHRWAMAQVVGWNELEGKIVMHLCDNPPCINVDHLRIGTLSDNSQDMTRKGRGRPGFTPGHRRSRRKLSDLDIADIRRQYQPGTTRQVDIAAQYGISQVMVSLILRGERHQQRKGQS